MATRRSTFTFNTDSDLSEDSQTHVLDEQEQEELIQGLRYESAASTRRFALSAQATVVLSVILHVVHLLRGGPNPILVLFPSARQDSPLPLSTAFSVLSILLQINFGLLLDPPPALDASPLPLPPQLAFALSAVAPVLSLLLQRPWQTIMWWLVTLIVGAIVFLMKRFIREGDEEIRALEKLKYHAKGA